VAGRAKARQRLGMADDPALDLMRRHYELGLEEPRLDEGLGSVEFARTLEVAARVLPLPPAVVADVGGGPGRYTRELAGRGYTVIHRDLVPLHVEQLRAASGTLADRIQTAVGDARELDLDDDSVDAVLLLGPLYHLVERDQRILALTEALRVARPGAPVLVSAISRWAPRLHGYLAERLYERAPFFPELVLAVEKSGRLNDSVPGWFTGYCHRPEQLREEVEEAGLVIEDLVGLEGLAFALGDLAERLQDPVGREVVLDCARAIERVPELLGLSPHLLVVARAARAG
jgi:SAM-dependent methyltransferase